MIEESLICSTILVEAGFVLIKTNFCPSTLRRSCITVFNFDNDDVAFPLVDGTKNKEKSAAPDTIKIEFITIKSRQKEKFNGENGFKFDPMLAVNGS